MTDKTALASISKAERQALLARSDIAGAAQAGLHLGLALIVGSLITLRLPGWQVLLPIQGILLIFLFTALHETIHKTAFRSPRYNDIVATISGFVVLVPPQWFRLFHFAHHRFTHDADNDPELAEPKARTFFGYVRYMSGLPVWWSQAKGLVVNALGGNADPFVDGSERRKVRREARIFLCFYIFAAAASFFMKSNILVWAWWVPVLIGQPFLRGYLLAEHTGCAHVTDMLVNSRTTMTNSVVRFLTWNMPYHAEHHAMPAVPFYRLPDLHACLRSDLGVVENGYLGFHARHVKSLRTSV